MGVFSSMYLMKLGVLVWRIFPILKFHMKQYGWGGLGKTWLVPLTPSTSLVKVVTGVETSKLLLITLQWLLLALVLYAVVIATNSSITSVLSDFGAFTAPVLMAKDSWLLAPIITSIGGANTGTSPCPIPIFQLLNKCWSYFRLDRPQIGLVFHSPLLCLDHFLRRLLSSLRRNQSDCFWRYLLSNFRLYWLDYHSSFSLYRTYQPWRYLLLLAPQELLYQSLL